MNRSKLYEGLDADTVLEIMKYSQEKVYTPYGENMYTQDIYIAYDLGKQNSQYLIDFMRGDLGLKAYRALDKYTNEKMVSLQFK